MKLGCTLFFTVAARVSSVSAGCAGPFENTTDFNGNDVGDPVTGVDTADACCALCTADRACLFWTFLDPTESPEIPRDPTGSLQFPPVTQKTCYKKWSDTGRRSLNSSTSGSSGPKPPFQCSTELDCSLNGLCQSGKCVCDKPWEGAQCGRLGYAVTSAVAKNAINGSWGAPVIGPVDGNYHMYLQVGNVLKNCITTAIEGPWNCSTEINGLPGCNCNPAAIMYKDPDSGKNVYLLWVAGQVPAVSDSPWGPFTQIPQSKPPDTSNPTVVFHNKAFYYTTQHAKTIWTTPKLNQPWTEHGSVNFNNAGTREDAFLWVDKRGNFHLIGHAYDTSQKTNCGTSLVSDHGFSSDGKTWHNVEPFDRIGPYTHTVEYDDGSSHVYSTLERPALYFDADGQPTHLMNGAEFVAGDKGCAPTACVDCKYNWTNSGTIVTRLNV